MGGKLGTGGAGGSHPPNCSSFPAGSTFTPPTDNLLHCYWTHADQLTWESAEANCVNEGGTLATILSSQENMAVLQFALRATLFDGGANVVWLGASDGKQSNDKSGPGKYAWVTGETWGFTNWHSSQPDGSCTCQTTNGCACDHWLAIGNDGTWYDRDDSSGRPYVCEAIAR
jgi:Lectin C-type domain